MICFNMGSDLYSHVQSSQNVGLYGRKSNLRVDVQKSATGCIVENKLYVNDYHDMNTKCDIYIQM